jgi:hypothetical protein
VRGSKRGWLFPPTELEYFYPFELDAEIPAHNSSRVNVERPDDARLPRFRHTVCLEAELREGDLRFLPAFWFHSLLHTGRFNASVNFWWRPTALPLHAVSERWAWLRILASALTCQSSDGAGPRPGDLASLSAESLALLRCVDALSRSARGG